MTTTGWDQAASSAAPTGAITRCSTCGYAVAPGYPVCALGHPVASSTGGGAGAPPAFVSGDGPPQQPPRGWEPDPPVRTTSAVRYVLLLIGFLLVGIGIFFNTQSKQSDASVWLAERPYLSALQDPDDVRVVRQDAHTDKTIARVAFASGIVIGLAGSFYPHERRSRVAASRVGQG